MTPVSILIVEDEPQISSLIRDYLSIAGFVSAVAETGPDGLRMAKSGGHALVLLDVMLPGMDGFKVLEILRRESQVPVILLTAMKEDADKIKGLGLGADDYLTKPFSPAELVARVKNRLARNEAIMASGGVSLNREDTWLADGGLELNLSSRRVRKRGDEISLTAREFDVLHLFITNPDRVFPREELYSRLWGDDHFGDISTVAVHIRRLREKIEDDPSKPERIETAWGMGYRWKPVG